MSSAHQTGLQILSWPAPLRENPYQRLLYAACEEAGAELLTPGKGLRRLRLLIGGRRARVLHIHWIWLKGGLLRRFLRAIRAVLLLHGASRLGWTIVWTVHNLEPHEEGSLDRWVQKHLLERADGFLCHTLAARTQLESRLDRVAPIAVVPHGNYLGAYPAPPSREEARKRLDLQIEGPIFAFVGQLRPYKGVLELMEALAEVPGPARLLIAGGCPDRAFLDQLRSAAGRDDRIRLEARTLDDEELGIWTAAADFVVLPFRRVTTSGSLLLALGHGRPVVIPAFPGLVDTATAEAAITFDPQAPGDLARALRDALERDAEAMGRAAKERARDFDWGPIGALTTAFFNGLRETR